MVSSEGTRGHDKLGRQNCSLGLEIGIIKSSTKLPNQGKSVKSCTIFTSKSFPNLQVGVTACGGLAQCNLIFL